MASEVYLILIIFFAQSSALDLTINDNGKSIVFESSGIYYAITMWEELGLPIKLGRFSYAGSSVGLEFRLPSSSANDNLGLTLTETESGVWEIDITLRQDYESLPDTGYYFIISAGTDTANVGLNIININDNVPIISAASASCKVEEHNTSLTDCRYTVNDEDGHIQSLSTSLSGDYDDIFEFVYETDVTSNDVKEVVLLLRPKVELDYEVATLYVFDLTVVDTPLVENDIALEGTARVKVEVIDIANTPPLWTSTFRLKVFYEMEPQLSTEDGAYPFNTDSVDLRISLKNLNDEIPVFDIPYGSNGYIAEIAKTAPAGSGILKVTAYDADIDDAVRYFLIGSYINTILAIDEEGYITTLVDGAFDYATEKEVIFEVQAVDTLSEPFNTAIVQVTITIIDENDETSKITAGSARAEIEETLGYHTEIIGQSSDTVTAIDDGQNEDLEFDIVRRLRDKEFRQYKT